MNNPDSIHEEKESPREPGGAVGNNAESALGIASFLQEDYAAAVRHFEAALVVQPERVDWRELLDLARANAFARIDVLVPPRHSITREALLSAPMMPSSTLPAPPPPLKQSLAGLVDQDDHGRPRLTFALPDGAALDNLTHVLARLLAQAQPG